MKRRGLLVGLLGTVSVALAAGWSSGGVSASAPGGFVGFGGTGVGSRALGGLLWLLVLGVILAGGGWVVFDRLRSAGQGGESVRRRLIALVVAVVVFVIGAVLFAVRVFEDGSGASSQDGVGGPLLQGSQESATDIGAPSATVVLGLLAIVVLVGVIVASYRLVRVRQRETDRTAAESEDPDTEPAVNAGESTDDLGAAAARAADHLRTDPPLDNDVVRAWRELTVVLPVGRPATATPREFAAAAIDAGVDPAAVDELTTLFEAVRYGDRDPSGARARRAVAALERIEAERAANGDERTEPRGDEVTDQ